MATNAPPTWVEELRQRPTVKVDEAAEILGMATRSAYDAVHRGEIPTIRIGRRFLVPTTALLRMLGVDTEDPS